MALKAVAGGTGRVREGVRTQGGASTPPSPPPAGGAVPPTITSAPSQTIPENSPFSLILTANESVTWSIVGGADASLFDLSGSTVGAAAMDYELPADANADNVYELIIRATSVASGLTTDQAVTVTVTDVVESTSPLSFATLFVGDLSSMTTSAGKVSAWNSLDSGGVSLVQADTAKQPTFDATNGLVFDGSGNYLRKTGFAIGTQSTLSVFLAVSCDTDISGDAGMVSYSAGGTATDYATNGSFAIDSPGSGPGIQCLQNGNSVCSASFAGATLKRAGVIFDGANVTVYVDNASGASSALSVPFISPGSLAVGLLQTPGLSNFFKGKIKKLVVTTVALNSTQRSELDTWLSA